MQDEAYSQYWWNTAKVLSDGVEGKKALGSSVRVVYDSLTHDGNGVNYITEAEE